MSIFDNKINVMEESSDVGVNYKYTVNTESVELDWTYYGTRVRREVNGITEKHSFICNGKDVVLEQTDNTRSSHFCKEMSKVFNEVLCDRWQDIVFIDSDRPVNANEDMLINFGGYRGSTLIDFALTCDTSKCKILTAEIAEDIRVNSLYKKRLRSALIAYCNVFRKPCSSVSIWHRGYDILE